MNANCLKCQQQTTFLSIKNKKYQCQKCKTMSHKCRNDSCINMVSFGLYCSKCVGRGLKNKGAGALTVFTFVGGIAAKVLLSRKGKS
jgi:late competence protein required for DNA uptake (superfamily II DNA/RNA helicase)